MTSISVEDDIKTRSVGFFMGAVRKNVTSQGRKKIQNNPGKYS